ncbi:MAG: heavy metal-binding domain-containing protein [Kiritimatiellia bacterium]|nr:heavy metal-binding domain-containing protein [Kiritimatiellia bacterium]
MDQIIGFSVFLVILVAGFWVGRVRERNHLASLDRRERELKEIRLSSLRRIPDSALRECPPILVTGEVTIASDAFKTWAAGLRNLFGGEVRNFSRLYQRARREATARMLEAAKARGCNAVCNVRYGSADIGGNAAIAQKSKKPMASCTVSGTAFRTP